MPGVKATIYIHSILVLFGRSVGETIMSDENTIRDTAEAIKGVVEAVPVYQDTVQPAAKEVGTALQTVAKTLHVLLAPVSALVWGYDKIKDHITVRMEAKLRELPQERLQAPEPHVAGPVLEALRYTGYQESLRELYTNLLASSLDTVTARDAHPAFVEIIKQMSPDEALVMNALAIVPMREMLDIRNEQKNSGIGRWVMRNFSLLPKLAGVKCPDLCPTYLINLQRLGLVELRENYTLKKGDEDLYQELRNAPEVQAILAEIEREEGHKANIIPGAIIATSLGHQFFRACVYTDTHK